LPDNTGVATAIRLQQAKGVARAALAGALLALGLSAGAQTQDAEHTITWSLVDWAPMTLLRDGKAPATAAELGDGGLDRALAEIIQRLPAYKHEFKLLNRQRLIQTFEHGDNLCDAAWFKTPEREKVAIFSAAIALPPIALVVSKKARRAMTGGKPEVSLAGLIRNPAFKGRLEAGRSYGPGLDKVLADSGQAVPRDIVPTTGALLNLLALGRFDYTLEYPMVARYFDTQSGKPPELEVVQLREARDWPVSYVACTRSAWGQRVIRDIDAAIRQAAKSTSYRNGFALWLPPGYLARNKAHVDRFYDARARMHDPAE
jgi:uncharacterized protein (TIGR02285 family)